MQQFDRDRYIKAQDENHAYDVPQMEMGLGRRVNNWVPFVFPAMVGYDENDEESSRYWLDEDGAMEFWKDPVLRERLTVMCQELLRHQGQDIKEILGEKDARRVHSSISLFGYTTDDPIFEEIQTVFFGGEREEATKKLLCQWMFG